MINISSNESRKYLWISFIFEVSTFTDVLENDHGIKNKMARIVLFVYIKV